MGFEAMAFGHGTTRKPHHVRRSVEIAAPCARVYDLWTRFEDFPRWTDAVRRTKRIDAHHVLWDAEVAGRQLVWEAEILEAVPGRCLRWRSVWGAKHAGEIRFVELDAARTRVTVALDLWPKGWLERLGARLGVVAACLEHDLERLAGSIERASRREASAERAMRDAPPDARRAGHRRAAGARR
jgi:uncharacterized membrane protein